jgi:predicted Rossmann-fold nucleotide-binding protein
VVLVGSGYWSGLLDWLRERLEAEAMIAPTDLDMLTVSDDPDEVADVLWRAACAQGLA